MIDYQPNKKSQNVKAMTLQFPNARLFLHELLSKDGLSGPEAIVKTACEYGLVKSECADAVRATEVEGTCPCMATAKNVLLQYFEQKNQQALPAVNVDQVWSTVERCAEAYKQASNRCPQECSTDTQPHECTKLAPALFDFLLQQINRYP